VIRLTDEWTKSAAARAVPGAAWDADEKAWVLHAPTPRAAAVALKLFPGLEHEYPELVELRAVLVRDAKPVDYATNCGLRIGADRVRAALAERGWSFEHANVTPLGAGEDFQSIDLGYLAEVLRRHGGGYLGWARGLGKTLGTAALIDELDCKTSLVVAPNTAKQATWASELGWALPDHAVIVLPNDKAKREHCLADIKTAANVGERFVLVVHYEALAVIAGKDAKGNVGDGWKRLGIHWDIVAADEGHRIANPKAKQTKALKKIPRTYALLASGSVFQNNWEELFSPAPVLVPEGLQVALARLERPLPGLRGERLRQGLHRHQGEHGRADARRARPLHGLPREAEPRRGDRGPRRPQPRAAARLRAGRRGVHGPARGRHGRQGAARRGDADQAAPRRHRP
jgi:hypothetical protein